MSSFMSDLIETIRRLVSPKRYPIYQINANEVGFELREDCNAGFVAAIKWTDIVEIIAYKRDLFTIDQLCIDFSTSSGFTGILDEDMVGFGDFLKEMEVAFPSIKKTDWSKVMQPPFAENRTVLYRRDS